MLEKSVFRKTKLEKAVVLMAKTNILLTSQKIAHHVILCYVVKMKFNLNLRPHNLDNPSFQF